MKELTLKQAAEDCRGTLTPEQAEGMITGVQIDSRRVKPGDLFVAIKGEKSDGHDFIGMAASLGASAALVQKPVKAAIPTILVPDTIKAYGDLAAARRERMGVTVIGITGSVGKTTTKEMTACMLERTYRTARTEGNHNNNIGLPMTILDMPDDTETAVLELGMNHFGEMARLTSIAKPDIAVITNIGTMHIEHLGSREGILQAKLEIFRGVPENGVGVSRFFGTCAPTADIKNIITASRTTPATCLRPTFRSLTMVCALSSAVSATVSSCSCRFWAAIRSITRWPPLRQPCS